MDHGDLDGDAPAGTSPERDKQDFHWRRALTESFTFLVIEQAYVVHTDFRWVVSENAIPFNHYWRDYTQSLTSWWRTGWSAGEDPLYDYLGHPIQLQGRRRDALVAFLRAGELPGTAEPATALS